MVGAAPQVVIEGHTFTVGGDWAVRIGNVTQGPGAAGGASGAAKGMIIEVGNSGLTTNIRDDLPPGCLLK